MSPTTATPIRLVTARVLRSGIGKNWSLGLGLGLLVVLVGVGIVALFWTPYAPDAMEVGPTYQPPSLLYPFGTDRLGADILSRTMAAATTDVGITVAVVGLSLFVGSTWGALAGFFGGWFDYVTMRILELLNSFPALLFAMLVISIAGSGVLNVILVVAVLPLPDYVRLIRVEIRSKKTWPFADAAYLVGRRPLGVLFAHLVPNSLGPVLSYSSVNASWVVATVGALGFLGLGIEPGSAEWGSMISRGADAVLSGQWWVSFFPGLGIFLLAAAFHLVSDGLTGSRTQAGRR
jgi:peptide/nickel transport system permease protein